MENEKGTGSTKDSKTHPEATSNGGDPHTKSKKGGLSRSSSSSSSSSSNLLDLDEKNAPHQTEWSMVSTSPRSGTGPLSSSEILPNTPDWNASPRTSPPLQTMDRPTSYNPDRIPSSVFNSRNTSPMDWSVASNESLFSIHMGNNSFNRDHALLGKSGELTRPEEWSNSPSGDFNNLPTLPTVIETHNERASMKDTEEEENETPKMGSKKFGRDDNKEKTPKVEVPYVLASPPRLSDDSGNSSKSFAFPVYVLSLSHTRAHIHARADLLLSQFMFSLSHIHAHVCKRKSFAHTDSFLK